MTGLNDRVVETSGTASRSPLSEGLGCASIVNGWIYVPAYKRAFRSWLLLLPCRLGVKEHRKGVVMEHLLEARYGLTAWELLDALENRFRARVALEGAVAEVQMEKKIRALVGTVVDRHEVYDIDGYPDFGIWAKGHPNPLLAECKTVRDTEEAYRSGGEVVAYKVETQKTRASRGDPTSRYYGVGQFHILGVCLGKKTGSWSEFMFVRSADLVRHRTHEGKLAVMQRVPLPGSELAPWFDDLGRLLMTHYVRQ